MAEKHSDKEGQSNKQEKCVFVWASNCLVTWLILFKKYNSLLSQLTVKIKPRLYLWEKVCVFVYMCVCTFACAAVI